MFLYVVSLGIVLPEASASTMHVRYSEKDAGIKYLAYNHWYSDRDLCRNKHICSKWLFTSSADPLHRM